MKRILAVILVMGLFIMPVGAAEADKQPTADGLPEIKAQAYMLMDIKSGQILAEGNSDKQLSPASITKVMSLLLVMEAIDSGKMSLDTKITASEHACSMGGSQIWLEPNEQMTVDELLKATVIASANDATVALGEHIAGSEEGFVALMNERAKELGMNNTNFVNCTGLDADGHLTTAHDVAVMSAQLIKHDLIKKYSTVWMDTLRNGESELVNTNKLVRFYKGCTGLKTGTTSIAGYCLSATAQRDNTELVAVILNGDTSSERFEGAKKLLNYGFANYETRQINVNTGDITEIKVKKGTADSVPVKADKSFSILCKKNAKGEIKQTVDISEEITAPVKKGQKVGTVTLSMDGEVIGQSDITADESVDRVNIGYTWLLLLKSLFYL